MVNSPQEGVSVRAHGPHTAGEVVMPADLEGLPTVRIFGVPIADLDLRQLLSIVSRAVEARSGTPLTIAYANAHTCNLAWSRPQFRDDLQHMGVVYVDGNGPRVAAWLRGRSLPRRMTGADWIGDLCEQCERRSHSLYILGGTDGVAGLAAERLRARYPGLVVRGVRSGIAQAGEWRDIVRSIAATCPDILLVGMQSPGQERWIVEHAGESGVPVVWGTGGMLDYASGVAPPTPTLDALAGAGVAGPDVDRSAPAGLALRRRPAAVHRPIDRRWPRLEAARQRAGLLSAPRGTDAGRCVSSRRAPPCRRT